MTWRLLFRSFQATQYHSNHLSCKSSGSSKNRSPFLLAALPTLVISNQNESAPNSDSLRHEPKGPISGSLRRCLLFGSLQFQILSSPSPIQASSTTVASKPRNPKQKPLSHLPATKLFTEKKLTRIENRETPNHSMSCFK